MYHDLCIPYSSSSPEFLRTLSFLVELSYSVIAISLPLPPKPSSKTLPPPPSLPATPSGLKPFIKRLTLPILTSSDLPNSRLQHLSQTYDLIALRPVSEKTLLLATSTPDIDLISLDLSARWPFHFRPKMFSAAVKRGVYFEICYSAAVNPSSLASSSSSGSLTGTKSIYGETIPATDAAAARRNVISNGQSLVRALRGGRNVIFSSDARNALGLRGPMDVVNFGVLLGLSAEKGLEAVRDAPALVLRAAKARREGWRGVVLGVRVSGVENGNLEKSNGAGVKRKAADGDENEMVDKSQANGQQAAKTELNQKMSNRQRKKLAKIERESKQKADNT